jgi:gliding motility-associated-like protein
MTSNATPCLVSSTATSNAVSITVNPALIPAVAILANTTTACAGASLTFTATPTNGGTNPTYQWYVNGTAVAGQTNSTFTSTTLTNGASVTVQMTSNATPCLSTPTATSSPIVITINPSIAASVSISASTNTICSGNSVTFTATPTNGGITPTYQWFINGNPVAGQTNSTFTSTTLTNGASVTVQMTSNAAPCLIGSPTTSNAEIITVNPNPVVTATNNGPLCVTQQLDLTVTTIAGATYEWTGPQSFNSLSQNPSIPNVALVNAGNYTVTVNLNGCTSSATSTVTIVTGFPATINPSGPFCLNSGIVNLTASAGGGIWAGIGITNASNGSFNPSLGAVGINTISYTTPGACGGTSTIDILILPIPSISISSNVISGCAPLEVIFADNSTPTSSSVLWNFGNGVISSTLSTATYNSPGCYNVSLTSTNAGGCSTTETFIDFICVLEDPVADFTTDEFSTSLYNPTFELVNQSDFSVSYLWEFDNNTTSTLTDPTVSYPEEPGSYTVQLVAYNAAGCTDTITKILTVRDELVFFVPNSFTPNGDEFNNAFVPIFTSGFDPFEFNLTIINRWGELIFESNDATVGWDGTYHGKIVPDGMYVWKIRMKDIENDKKYTYTGHVNVLK